MSGLRQNGHSRRRDTENGQGTEGTLQAPRNARAKRCDRQPGALESSRSKRSCDTCDVFVNTRLASDGEQLMTGGQGFLAVQLREEFQYVSDGPSRPSVPLAGRGASSCTSPQRGPDIQGLPSTWRMDMVLMVGKLLARLSAIYTDRCCWWCGRFHFSTRQMCASCLKRHSRIRERSGRRPARTVSTPIPE